MNKREKKNLVPKLRFPEFRNAGEWEQQEVRESIEEYRKNSTKQHEFEVFTSARSGLVRQRDYYENSRLTERDNIGFNIIPPGYMTYRSRSDDRRFFFNENDLGITGIISTYYPVFRILNGSNKFFIELLSQYSIKVGKHSVGTSQTVLSMNELKKIQLPIPQEAEQQKIANCLISIDEVITAQTKKIDALKTHKKGLMQQLFPAEGETVPKLRFPEFRNKMEWEKTVLGKLVDIRSGFSPSRYTLSTKAKYAFLKVEDLNNCEKYQRQSREYSENVDGLVPANSVIFPKRGAAILLNKVRVNVQDVLMDTNLMAITPNKKILVEFLYYKIISVGLFKIADTSTIPQINNKHIEPYQFLIPSKPEQQEIANCLASIDELITAQFQKLDALKSHKKGLMQQLFPAIEEMSI